jgi:hypothetical protein
MQAKKQRPSLPDRIRDALFRIGFFLWGNINMNDQGKFHKIEPKKY